MKPDILHAILANPVRLKDLRPGDRLIGFEAWGCVPDDAVRVVRADADGALYVRCREGEHMLDGQVGEDGCLLGMARA